MITQETKLEALPPSIQKKWAEDGKALAYVEGDVCLTIENTDELARMCRGLLANSDRIIGFDTEATSVRPETAGIVGMSFSVEDHRGFYVPVAHEYGKNVELDAALEIVQPVLQSQLSMAGGKFDWHLMKRHGVDVKYGVDSQSLSRLLGEVDFGVGLKETVARMFDERQVAFTDVVTPAERKKGRSFAHVEIGVASLYAVPDAIYTRRVSRYAWAHLPDVVKQMLLAVEHDVMRIAGEMEWVGLPLDEEFLQRHIEAGTAMAETLKAEAIVGLKAVAARRGRDPDEIPDDLNMNSNDQMRAALFDVCGFTPVKRSKKTGNPSADKASIEKMAEKEPEVDWIRRFRSAESRVGDLSELLDFGLHERGWFWVHGSLNPTGTGTGRWSSSGPNLQNIPKGKSTYESRHSTWEIRVRDAIKAPPGWHIVTADYSQIELRVAAGESGCRRWMDAFAAGEDVHAASGAAIYNVPIEHVTKKQRDDGKTYNFALLFGQEVGGTATALGVAVAEAQRMQNAYWEGLPEVKTWMDGVQQFAKSNLYVETKFGRRRWLRGISSSDVWIHRQNMREAVNTVVQGTAADILKIGLRRAEGTWKALGAKLFLVVHDQYVWLVPESVTPGQFCRAVDEVINFDIPGYPEMVSDYGIGDTFDSLIEFPSAASVPDTWDEAFAAEQRVDDDEMGGTLHIEIEDIDIEGLTQLAKLVTSRPGEREVILHVTNRSLEKPMNDRTNLGMADELAIRAAIGNAAKVTMV